MTTLDTSFFKNKLEQQRASLLEQLTLLRGGAVSRAQASAEHFAQHEDPQAQRATERDLELALDEHESSELSVINAALQRIKTGTYGICTDCGTTIPKHRLEVAPEAARCVPCQEKAEQR